MSCLGRAVLLLFAVQLPAHAAVFYQLESPDGQRSWLMGTLHSDDPRLLEFPDSVQEALAQSEIFLMELKPDLTTLDRIQQAMYFNDETRLDDVLPPALFERTVQVLETYDLGLAAIRRLKPWAAALTASVPPPRTGLFMDFALSLRAQGAGAEVIALETADEQISLFSELPLEQQVTLLEVTMEQADDLERNFEALTGHWLAGDLEALEAFSMAELKTVPAPLRAFFLDRALAERNRRMFQRALPHTRDDHAFIAVGALHLVGDSGLIEQFRKAGYTVEKLE